MVRFLKFQIIRFNGLRLVFPWHNNQRRFNPINDRKLNVQITWKERKEEKKRIKR